MIIKAGKIQTKILIIIMRISTKNIEKIGSVSNFVFSHSFSDLFP